MDFLEYDASSVDNESATPKSSDSSSLTGSLSGDPLEDIVDEGVENGHRLVGDTSVRVDLFED